MKVKYIDAHCHIQFEQFDDDQSELIERMRQEGVVGIVVGVDLVSSQRAVTLAEKHEHLFASIGLHPNYEADEWCETRKYRALAQSPKVMAIGECGLDYFRPDEINDEVKRKQKAILNDQIILAAELDKPLIIHSRPSKGTRLPDGSPAAGDAYQDLISILKEAKEKYPKLRGDIHFFVGGVEEAQAFIALDFTLSFTAVITFARDYEAVIRAIPLGSILSETDAPYVAPARRRGKRNDPLAVVDVVAKIAEIRGENIETVRSSILANGQNMLRLPQN